MTLVSVDSTTARGHHDAAGMRIGKEVMDALEEATDGEEQARQKGAARRDRTDRSTDATSGEKSGDASGDGADSA